MGILKRRDFLTRAAATAALGAASRWTQAGTSGAVPFRARPFPLSAVRLGPGMFRESVERNRRYMMSLDPDRLLHMFRVTAGLPSTAQPLGGWEQPENELRGHFTGHYLSACALLHASLGDAEVKARGDLMVAELAKCQAAARRRLPERLSRGVLRPAPPRRQPCGRPSTPSTRSWPACSICTCSRATRRPSVLLKGMAGWTRRFTMPLGRGPHGPCPRARVRRHERGALQPGGGHGGFLVLRGWRVSFDHERIFAPLAEGRDELKGLHANTTIPKIIGAARRYELTGERRYRDVAEYFWDTVTRRAVLLHRRYQQRRGLAGPTPAISPKELSRLHPGMLLHLQHAEAHPARLRLDRRPAMRRLLRARALERDPGHPAPRRRHDPLLRAPRLGLLEALRPPYRGLLVLHRLRRSSRSPSSPTASTSTTTTGST